MNVLIAGGAGFLGGALTRSLLADNHRVWILSRNLRAHLPEGAHRVLWDAKTTDNWGYLVDEMDAVVHLAGKSLASWPWTSSTKRLFVDSRVGPGLALASAIEKSTHRPRLFIQQSGINHYGLKGDLADEFTPPAGDFLAQLTVEWENATRQVEDLGLRRVISRSAVVLGRGEGLLPMMSLPVQLFFGGPLGEGTQAMPWIHIRDWVSAVRFLMQDESAHGVYNLIAPRPTSGSDFVRALAEVLRRPFWFPVPAFLLRLLLGEMSVLITEGRYAQPKRLIESGYRFQFEGPREALADLFG
jgi:uncharacterized protein (TIGR01777 family)